MQQRDYCFSWSRSQSPLSGEWRPAKWIKAPCPVIVLKSICFDAIDYLTQCNNPTLNLHYLCIIIYWTFYRNNYIRINISQQCVVWLSGSVFLLTSINHSCIYMDPERKSLRSVTIVLVSDKSLTLLQHSTAVTLTFCILTCKLPQFFFSHFGYIYFSDTAPSYLTWRNVISAELFFHKPWKSKGFILIRNHNECPS